MIISMKLHATKEEVAQVRARIEEFGYKVHSIEGEERVVIGAVGMGDVTACLESLEAMPQVEKAVRISAPYKFVSKEFRPEKTEIKVHGATIGGDDFVVMAGPCSVESEKQILESGPPCSPRNGKSSSSARPVAGRGPMCVSTSRPRFHRNCRRDERGSAPQPWRGGDTIPDGGHPDR